MIPINISPKSVSIPFTQWEQGNSVGSPHPHAQNGDAGSPGHVELAGMEGNHHSENGAAVEVNHKRGRELQFGI